MDAGTVVLWDPPHGWFGADDVAAKASYIATDLIGRWLDVIEATDVTVCVNDRTQFPSAVLARIDARLQATLQRSAGALRELVAASSIPSVAASSTGLSAAARIWGPEWALILEVMAATADGAAALVPVAKPAPSGGREPDGDPVVSWDTAGAVLRRARAEFGDWWSDLPGDMDAVAEPDGWATPDWSQPFEDERLRIADTFGVQLQKLWLTRVLDSGI